MKTTVHFRRQIFASYIFSFTLTLFVNASHAQAKKLLTLDGLNNFDYPIELVKKFKIKTVTAKSVDYFSHGDSIVYTHQFIFSKSGILLSSQIGTMGRWLSTTDYTADSNGHFISKKRTDSLGKTVEYSRHWLTYQDNKMIRDSSSNPPVFNVIQYKYHSDGRIDETEERSNFWTGNIFIRKYIYDSLNRIVSIKTSKTEGQNGQKNVISSDLHYFYYPIIGTLHSVVEMVPGVGVNSPDGNSRLYTYNQQLSHEYPSCIVQANGKQINYFFYRAPLIKTEEHRIYSIDQLGYLENPIEIHTVIHYSYEYQD